MSITLPSNLISSLVVGGVTVETDPNYAVTEVRIDYLSSTYTFILRPGTTSGQSFAAGNVGPTLEFRLDTVGGVWSVQTLSGVLTGTLDAGGLAFAHTVLTDMRNNSENFAVNNNVFPGATQVAWT